MSRSPFFYLEVYNNEENKWLYVDPLVWNYNRTKRVPADLWPFNGTHELFDILGVDSGVCSCDFDAVRSGLPPDCNEEIAKVFKPEQDDEYGIYPHAHWFTYADMEIYLLKKPKVEAIYEEPDEDGNIPMMDNPMFGLKNRIDAFLEVWDDMGIYYRYPSDIRVVFDVV